MWRGQILWKNTRKYQKSSAIPRLIEMVPVVSNLPRTTPTWTTSTASSTSDVSCRSNPNVPSYCANTNMSSEISSMFYGAVLHVNTLNVYTNPHNWALHCLTVLVNTLLWISSVCWNKWLIFLFALLCLVYLTLGRIVDVYLLPSHVYNLCTFMSVVHTCDVCDIN